MKRLLALDPGASCGAALFEHDHDGRHTNQAKIDEAATWMHAPAAGRRVSKPRRELDRYYTPASATRALLAHLPELRGDLLLDPCAGDGRMAAAIGPGRFARVRSNDLD